MTRSHDSFKKGTALVLGAHADPRCATVPVDAFLVRVALARLVACVAAAFVVRRAATVVGCFVRREGLLIDIADELTRRHVRDDAEGE